MEDFKTYKPLLSAIKNEYDLYITYLQQQIEELQPLKVITCDYIVRPGLTGLCTFNILRNDNVK